MSFFLCDNNVSNIRLHPKVMLEAHELAREKSTICLLASIAGFHGILVI